ncbi:cytochrome P450 [Rhodococcus sp. WAY2]|uniref:cytochrome P450 n=1 Tax=Rhodococcus sp. WAY2 TaxID=2663121 RepID=UPI00131FB8FE|nr:cytochrome P450 [Rhodococcus sp. WAY2]QHE73171.1 putative cytochrome P450 hydroxylase [Rhodococcus sp. WAY2]
MTQNPSVQPFKRDMFSDFDFEDPEFNERFDEVLNEMAAKCPVAHSQSGHGYKVINTYKDVKKAAQDWRTFSSAKGYAVNRPEGTPTILPEESDPPYHDKWRKALNPFFSPTTVAGFEDQIRTIANELIDNFETKGSCNFVRDFSAHLPGMVFFRCVMGVPEADLPELFEGIDKGTFGPVEERPQYFMKVNDYLSEYLEMRSKEAPRGDVVDIVNAGVTREDGEPAPWEDKVAIVLDLVFGGLATTTHAMTAAVNYLAQHEDVRRELCENPGLIPQAVEEFVRLFAPVVAPARYVTQDTTLGDLELREGDWIALNYAAVSRDPATTEDPTTLDIHRKGVVHTAFGMGPHRCLGSHLARLELKVTLEEFLRRIPNFHITEGTSVKTETGQLRTTTSLEITFDVDDEAKG